MRVGLTRWLLLGLALSVRGVMPTGQSGPAADAHVARARAAAGQDHMALFDQLCAATSPAGARQAGNPGAAPASGQSARQSVQPPDRAQWHAEPVKVFDNLYFIGQSEYSAWAVTTSAGIIVIDAIYDYSVEDEVAGGLRKLGLDPAGIKYVIVSHGHGDHSGGAKFLQDTYGAHVILSAEDWALLDRSNGTRPRRDIVATDGYQLRLGDTTLTLYLTPGHTYGTISTLIPVKDNGQPHVVAEWGGTAFNWVVSPNQYITPERPAAFWFKTYSQSAERFKDIVTRAGADALISNHSNYDGSKVKLPAVLARKRGDPNPYVIGALRVQNYLTVASECAQAALARSP